MSAVPKKKLTPEEYLKIERAALTKSEFYNGEMFAMAGASLRHNMIKENFSREIGIRTKGGPCRTLSGDMRVLVKQSGLYTYPDILLVCEPPRLQDEVFDTLLNPNIIVEVLSDTTEKYDRGVKFKLYRGLDSLREYILVSQDSPTIERYFRQADNSWNLATFSEINSDFELASLPLKLPMADIFSGVDFSETEAMSE